VWIDKLNCGLLKLITPMGPRYLMPSFWQRVYLFWVFRHFPVLPHIVLSRRAQNLIRELCSQQSTYSEGFLDAPLLGTVERLGPSSTPTDSTPKSSSAPATAATVSRRS